MDFTNLIIGFVGLLVAIAALLYNRKTYKKDYVEKPNEEKLHLLAQFKATQKVSHNLYNQLLLIVEQSNAYDQEIFEGVSYEVYLNMLQKSNQENLSEELYNKLMMENLPTMTIQSMANSLEKQAESLRLIQLEVTSKLQPKAFPK